MLETAERTIFTDDHNHFRDAVRKFIQAEVMPNLNRWEDAGVVESAFWTVAGKAGLIAPTVPTEYGGLGLDFAYNTVVTEELAYAGANLGISLQFDLIADYIIHLGSEEQKRKWLPQLVSGEIITANAMSESGAGSDLQASG